MSLDRARHVIVLPVERINDIGRHRKFRCAGDRVKPPRLQQRLHDPACKKSGAAIVQHMLQSEPADIRRQRRTREIREESAVAGIEFRSPVDIDITRLRLGRAFRIGRHQNELLFEQLLDLEARAALRRVHHADIDAPFHQPLHDLRLERAFGPNHNFRIGRLHQRQPSQQIFLPQADAAANDQCSAEAFGNADVMARLLDCPHQRRGMTLKLPARRRQRGAGLVANEQRATELLLERMNARADSRLADVETLRSGDEIARGHHGQERSGQFGIHGAQNLQSTISISNAAASRMSKLCPAAAINHRGPLTRRTGAPMRRASVGRTAAPAMVERLRGRKVRAPSTYGAG